MSFRPSTPSLRGHRHRHRSCPGFLLPILMLVACGPGGVGPQDAVVPGEVRQGGELPPPLRDSVFAYLDVHVVPMDRDAVLRDQVVVVRDGLIAAMGPAGSVDVPAGATVIDGDGGYLMPGLVDMHVHLSMDDLETYVFHGVTTVRNMWGWSGIAGMREAVGSGEIAGPTIHSVSPGLDGTPPKWPETQIVATPVDADSVVQAQHDAGWRTLKLYSDLRPDVYDAIVEAARARDMDFVGHVPRRIEVEHVLESGQRSIEHLGGYQTIADPDRLQDLILYTAHRGTWNCPTISVQRKLGSTRVPKLRELVRRLDEGGAGLLVGTDSGIGLTRPGVSIHVEIAEFVAAGLSPYRALLGATRHAARFLGAEGEFGVVAPGLRADLLLLDGNPLEDVRFARRPRGVMLRGAWMPFEASASD